ncbi:MAG: hypothetical protein ACO1SV_18440 [Fimbriimonas sp.]
MRCVTKTPKTFRTLALAAVATASSAAVADSPPFMVRLGVPDFDQRWSGLPGGGGMYCVPTSLADLFKYLDNNGLPAMSPVPSPSAAGYNAAIESHLSILGGLMGTDAEEGTTGNNSFWAAKLWAAQNAPNVLMYQYFYGPDWSWGTAKIRKVVSSGSLAQIGYGRYYKTTLPIYSHPVWYRDGGHAVACVGYDYIYDDEKWLLVNDPASDDKNGTVQGPMMYDYKRTENLTLFALGYGEVSHARYTLTTGSDGNKRAMIDSMHQIMPLYAGWWEAPIWSQGVRAAGSSIRAGDGSVRVGDGSVRVVIPWQPTEQRRKIPNEYRFTPTGRMVDWVLALGELTAFYLTSTGDVVQVDLESGKQSVLKTLPGAKRILESGTTMDLYVLVSGKERDQIVMLDRDGKGTTTHDLPFRAAALEHDPLTGGPAVADVGHDEVYSLTEDLRAFSRTKITSPIPPGAGEVIFRIDPETGDFLTSRKGAFEYFRYSRRQGSDVPMRQKPTLIAGITSLSPTENGLVAVQDGSVVSTYDRYGLEQKTQLSGLKVQGELKLARSHMAAKPGQMIGKAWRNVWPVEE